MRFGHAACSELVAQRSLEQLLPAAHPAVLKLAPPPAAHPAVLNLALPVAHPLDPPLRSYLEIRSRNLARFEQLLDGFGLSGREKDRYHACLASRAQSAWPAR